MKLIGCCQFIPGLTPEDSPRAADSGSLRPAGEVTSRQSSLEVSSVPTLSKDISEQVTSKTSYNPNLMVDSSEPNTTKLCPGLPPSVDASEQNTTRSFLESRLLTDTTDLSTLKTDWKSALPLDPSEPNTSRTNDGPGFFKMTSNQMASAIKSITTHSPKEPSCKLTSLKLSSPETNSLKASADASHTRQSSERSHTESADETPRLEKRGAGVKVRKESSLARTASVLSTYMNLLENIVSYTLFSTVVLSVEA